jgi:prolyl oligopeptidase
MAEAAGTAVVYPPARRSQHTDAYQGVQVADPYRWLEDLDSAETQAWVAAERALTAKVFAGTPERAALRNRLTQLWNFPHYGLPIKRGGRIFFRKNDGLQNQAVFYVQDREEAAPRPLFDPNALSRVTSGTWRPGHFDRAERPD